MEELYYTHEVDDEPIPGYRLLQPLGRGGFGEVWKCEAPGGLLKAIKFVHGGHHLLDDNAPADEELRAIQRVKTIRHPFILMMERVEIVEGELVIVMELADQSLADVLEGVKARGKPGIERATLLSYLREAAEVLDVMNARHGLQHLDIKPRNLFLVSDHVKVGDFGLVSSLSASMGEPALGAITPLYASPEVFQGSISAHSDQYSLAIVYQELLTGSLPFQGKNSRQLLMAHLSNEPDLSALPEADRPIIYRALSKNPIDRFPTCTEMMAALKSGQSEVVTSTTVYLTEAEVPARSHHETRLTQALKTVQTRCVQPRSLSSAEVRNVELLSRTPLSEVWRGAASDGTARVVQVFFGCVGPSDPQFIRLRELRHPSLLPLEIVEHTPGRLVLVSTPNETSLRGILAQHQSEGRPGIPRAELLGYLQSASESLGYLQQTYGLNHLSLNPRTLIVKNGQLKMSEFGMIQLAWKTPLEGIAQINGRYSAPELVRGKYSEAADQYSLALIYHEMLTGVLPTRKADGYALDRLPESDRLLIGRALQSDPSKRWSSTRELLTALISLEETQELPPQVPGVATRQLVPSRTQQTPLLPQARPLVEDPLSGERMQTKFGTNLAADVVQTRLEAFRQQWGANVVSLHATTHVYQMATPPSLWQRWTGRQPRLDIRVEIAPEVKVGPVGMHHRTEVRMMLHPRECNREQCKELLKVVGPMLVESMRAHLQVKQNGRRQERVLWPYPLTICSMQADGSQGTPIECQGKDISLNGIGFYLPGQLPAPEVMLHLPQTAQTPETTLPARVVRVQECGKGWYEVGAILLPPDQLPPEDGEEGTGD